MTNPTIGRDAARLAYEDLSVGQVINNPNYGSLNGYRVDRVFGSTGSGVTAYALRNPSGEIVVAFRGTNDIVDWSDNLGNLGWRQWQEVKADVNTYLGSNWTGGEVTFTGHSLGGALAQYAAYDTASTYANQRDRLNIYTLNGLGARNGIDENMAGGFNPSVMFGVNAAHYFNPEDVVPRLGGGHVGGQTVQIGDVRSGIDGTLTAHSTVQFTDATLARGVPGLPSYYQNPTSQQNPEIYSELFSAFGAVVFGPLSVQELQRLRNAVLAVPVNELGETGRILADVAAGLAAEAYNFGAGLARDVAQAVRDVGRAVMDRVVNAVDAAVDLGVDAVGQLVNTVVDALTAAGEAGQGLLNYLGDTLDNAAGWIFDTGNSFADAIRDQLRRLIDPIVLDLDGNGIELTPRATSNVYFDMDGDGIKEQTGWVKPTDGLLAIDSNANGQIDNINELIGDLGRSGFAELVTYDLNNDRVINASDAVWSRFRVWLDANSNGLTDAGELRTLASLNIRSIDLRYTAVNFTAEGNRIHEQSIFEYTNGTTGLVADIWFDVSNVDTNSSISLTGNITIDNLPDIRGRGDVKSLRSVMLADGALATLVTGFVSQNLSSLANARSQAEQIIYRWAGVQSVDPSSRGGLFDGRKLAALEAFLGTQFVVQGIRNPNAQAVASLTAAWNGLVDGILARLLMSGPLGSAMADSAVYVPEIDRLMTVQTPADLLNSFKSKAPAGDGITVAGYWAAVLPLAREIIQDVGGDPTSTSFTTAVNAALENTGLAPFADLLTNGIIPLSPIPSVLQSAGVFRLTSGNDTLWLGTDLYAVFAGDGNDFLAFTTDNFQPQHLDGGAGNDQIYGTAANDWLDGGAGADTMAGAGGDDTYTVDNAGDVVIELANAGEDHVRTSITYTLASTLEHLTLLGTNAINGTGNASANRLSGNSAANRLEGLAGNDTLDGGAEADTLNGGWGADLYRIDATGDVIIETGSDIDTVEASLNYTLGARLENLVLIGTALNGTGNEANNSLWGNALNNTLNGAAGADTMIGGLGNDIYVVDNSSDSVQEEDGAGTDRVQSSISYTLSGNVEQLVLTGSQDLSGTGNDLANQLTGNSGDNWLDGDLGADTMSGGGGDDGYVVDNAGDVVTEAANAGIDWVYSTRSAYTLGANVENLQLYISWDDGINRNGTGNTLDNEIIGTSGSNILTALAGNDSLYGQGGTDSLYGGDGDDLLNGGSEQDRLEGGAGNDRYIVDLATDTVIEALNAGSDTVESSVSWILGANVEHLTLSEEDAIDGQGNGLNNQLTGNNGNNNLDGGAGADTMAGAGGDDTYTVDNAGDVVFELPTSGTDHVRSSITYALGAFVENLTLLGSGNINATGNTLANTISGNAGQNIISGGLGQDTLTGNTGADTFRFQTIEDSANFEYDADIITDFSLAQGDRIDISGIDAVASSVPDNAFVFIGSSAFSAAGQVRFFASSGMTYVSLNTNSDLNNVELMIALTGQLTMQQSHFLL